MQAPQNRNIRWWMLSLVFLATTINYLDRQVMGLLKPVLEKEFSWDEKDYSYIVMAFTTTYAIGYMAMGRFIDKVGTKIGYAVSLIVWSLASIGHGLVKSTIGFIIARSTLGISEAGNFPAAIKSVAEWFPKKKERWQQAFSTQEQRWELFWHRCWFRSFSDITAGDRLLYGSELWVWFGLFFGGNSMPYRKKQKILARKNCST